jgi:hypothetical protein
MVVNDFDLQRITRVPTKTESPLLVYANAVLTSSVALERLQLITRWYPQVTERRRGVEVLEFLSGTLLNLAIKPFHKLTAEYGFRPLVLERTNHGMIVTRVVPSV